VTLHARGEKFLHGVGQATVWETALTRACDKLAQQAQKVKGKWVERKRGGPRRGSLPVAEVVARVAAETAATAVPVPRPRVRTPRIVRATAQPLKAMTAIEAAREVQAQGDGVVIFRDTETSAISVLFRKPTGELTLVATDA
jgi:hypothetical protein